MGCRSNSAFIVSCVLFVAAIVVIVAGTIEIHKSRTYIKNDCQVIASDTTKLDCNDNGSNCRYKPVWTVLYDRPNDNDEPIEAVVDPSYLDTNSEAEAIKKQMEYKVDQIYPCYHNPRKHIVQWKQPSKLTGSLLLVGGFCLLAAAIAVFILWLNIMGLFEDKLDNTRDEEQPKTPEEATEVMIR